MSESTNKMKGSFKISDQVVAGLQQLLSLALMTGTDITDHLRMMTLEPDDDGTLHMTNDFIERTNRFAEMMSKRADEMAAELDARVRHDGIIAGGR